MVAWPVLDRAGILSAASDSSALSSSAAQTTYRAYQSPAGGWSVEIPTSWNVVEVSAGRGAIFRSYDAQRTSFEGNQRPRAFIPPSDLRIDVQWLMNAGNLSAKAAADAVLSAPDPTRGEFALISRRDDLVVAGQPATLLIETSNLPPQPQQTIRELLVVSPSRDRLFIIRAWPDRTTLSAELDHFTSTFVVR